MKQLWMILASVFAVVAVILFVRRDYDKAFVCAALGAVVWFLRYRAQLKELVRANQAEEDMDESLDTNEED